MNIKIKSKSLNNESDLLEVEDIEDTDSARKLYSEKLQEIRREIGSIIKNRDIELEDQPGVSNNKNLSTETPEEFLYKSLKRYVKKNRYEKIIRVVTQSVHRSIDLKDVIENALDAMNKHIETAENISIYMVEGEDAVLKSYRGYPEHLIKKLKRIPRPKGFTWKTIISGKPIHCPNVDKDSSIGSKGRELGTKSYVSMPICYSGKAIGCININSIKRYAFDNEELNLLEIVANQIETAVNNAKQAEVLRNSQQALRKAHDDLEQRVRERTSELEKTNRLLVKEILERRYAENGLKQSLTEKDVLLEEIHHRVNNNLQIISSLLNLQSRQLKDKKILDSFKESNNRIRSIATLHEQLYRSKDLLRIDFTAYIRNMTDNLLHSYGIADDSIKININSERIYLDINTAIPCGLILNELVSNAIKHGFPDRRSGEITVDFNRDVNRYILNVSNNGIQFPEELDINNCNSLGLKLVSSLSKQLKGSITLNTKDVTGFKLDFSC